MCIYIKGAYGEEYTAVEKVQKITINDNWCKNCGICIEFCPRGVYEADDRGRPLVVHAGKCTECLLCELYCPEFAISILEEK